MARRIFITATNTDIGKTFATLQLLRSIAARGLRVGVFKPIETGVTTQPHDGTLLLRTAQELNPDFAKISIDDVVPIQFALPAAPAVAKGTLSIDYATIDAALARIEAVSDVVLIEGAGGVYVPVDEQTLMIDLMVRFNAKVLLVSHCHLGCINDTLLSLNALQARPLRVVWTLNCRADELHDFATISKPYFDAQLKEYTLLYKDLERIVDALLN